MQKTFTISFLLFSMFQLKAQKINTNFFLRTPHIVNLSMTDSKMNYGQVISAGLGLSHKKKFIELATFIGEDETYGYYTFFGVNLKSSALDEVWRLNTNWFGEVTLLPGKGESHDPSLITTSGVCLFLNRQLNRVNIGLPICLGIARQEGVYSINSRVILNLSIAIN